LKKEFQWLLGEDFSKLLEGFEPVDNRAFMKKDADEQAAGKVTNSKNPFSFGQISIFWRVLGDKTTISEEKLQDGLVSTGKFSQSDAAMIIESMKREEFGIEQVDGWGTIRRKVKS
jgi:hypothetical protein